MLIEPRVLEVGNITVRLYKSDTLFAPTVLLKK